MTSLWCWSPSAAAVATLCWSPCLCAATLAAGLGLVPALIVPAALLTPAAQVTSACVLAVPVASSVVGYSKAALARMH
jgi:hypothetical protein